ncbi:SAVED domain-containing protein [Acinetobacter baumannii]|nr:SAVED domain-containing protein [Acinetobacter baumannii]ELA9135361.1 SAVED domain-containing protein [Acinetobacter baumannii]ELW9269505.1 SAVED domain-containing protein [Acinetobacter baumannii]
MHLEQSLSLQTSLPAIDSLENATKYFEEVYKQFKIDKLGVIVDEKCKNIIFVILINDDPLAFFRINLNLKDTLTFIRELLSKEILFCSRALQGEIIDLNILLDFSKLCEIWVKTQTQHIDLKDEINELIKGKDPVNILEEFLNRIFDFKLLTGRGDDLDTKSKNQVINTSHGRCMFNGCGIKLNIDEITGISGTYGVLAHNVASSEKSTRGIPFFSYQLSDDPKNILLLCEKHHRLIDKVAGAEYTAANLSQMRLNYIAECEDLLDSLSFTPMPVYLFFWPVNRSIPQSPSRLDVANCLRPLKAIMFKDKDLIHEVSQAHLRATSDEFYQKYFLEDFESQTSQLLRQAKLHDKRIAIFGFGPMPCLIALGSKLGNKGKFIPMLMYRDGNCWMWPNHECNDTSYTINSTKKIKNCNQVTIRLNLTANPELSNKIAESLGFPIINITAKAKYMGNGAIRNPERGLTFMRDIHNLLHDLKERGVTKIHILPCASNAACIWFGQAFDLNHPEMIIYDFQDNSMIPRLGIKNINNNNEVNVY